MNPEVSVVIPCYNEFRTIHLVLDALLAQTFPIQNMEVVIADGGSTDGTPQAIAEWAQSHPELSVKMVENKKKTIPSAVNTAIKASTGGLIVRMDAHSKPHPEYVERSVAALREGKAQNVGGVWDIQPGRDHWIARSIAVAAGHPIGVGGARYRYSEKPGFVETVPFGAFSRDLLDKVGLFDETLLANEDYEFNTRIRQNGGKVWFDPQIRSAYYARSTLKALAKQYWRYGFWKWQMLRRYPNTIRLRQALPPLFVAALAFLLFLSLFWQLPFWFFLALSVIYLIFPILTGVQLAITHKQLPFILGVPLAILTMHFTWGTGFLWGIIRPRNQNKG